MYESTRSSDLNERCAIPLRTLVAPAVHRPIPRDAEPVNDASCEPMEKPQDRLHPPARAIVSAPANDSVGDTEASEWVTGYDLYRFARIRRAGVQAALIRRACDIVADAARRAWQRYLRRRQMHAAYQALVALDDRALRDLGFHRSEIMSVAAELAGEAERTRMLPRAPRP